MSAAARPPSVTALHGPGAWFDHHLYSFVASLGRVVRKPWATLLTIGVMAVALALPLGLVDGAGQRRSASPASAESRADHRVPQDRLDATRAQALAHDPARRGDVAGVEVRTPDEGLQDLRDAAASARRSTRSRDNPLPSVLIVSAARRRSRRWPNRCARCRKPTSCSTTRMWRHAPGRLAALRRARRVGARRVAGPGRVAGRRQHRAPGHPVAARGDRRAAIARRQRRFHPPPVPVSRRLVRPGRRRAARSACSRRRVMALARAARRPRRQLRQPLRARRASTPPCWPVVRGRRGIARLARRGPRRRAFPSPDAADGRLMAGQHDLRHLVSDAPRVMVVDGSKLVRKLIGDVLRKELPNVEVVACDGIEPRARRWPKARSTSSPPRSALPDGDGSSIARIVREAARPGLRAGDRGVRRRAVAAGIAQPARGRHRLLRQGARPQRAGRVHPRLRATRSRCPARACSTSRTAAWSRSRPSACSKRQA